jgi:hypothetical protein
VVRLWSCAALSDEVGLRRATTTWHNVQDVVERIERRVMKVKLKFVVAVNMLYIVAATGTTGRSLGAQMLAQPHYYRLCLLTS